MQPSLDHLFRNPDTGAFKENLVFVVDNGPSENPLSSMVQMCLKRLCKFFNLERVTQVSFPEYNSKPFCQKSTPTSEQRTFSSCCIFKPHNSPWCKGTWKTRAHWKHGKENKGCYGFLKKSLSKFTKAWRRIIGSSMTKKTLRNFVRFPNSVKKLQVCPTEQGRHPWRNHCMMSGGLAWTTQENTGATTQWWKVTMTKRGRHGATK